MASIHLVAAAAGASHYFAFYRNTLSGTLLADGGSQGEKHQENGMPPYFYPALGGHEKLAFQSERVKSRFASVAIHSQFPWNLGCD
jgi:hypothetical protein